MTFMGYRRPDGRVGIRNKVLILPASVCASDTASAVAAAVEGTVTFHNQSGCGQIDPCNQITLDVMAGFAANPNIYGTVVISLGCENCQMDIVVDAIQRLTDKPLRQVIIQEAGGSIKAVELATRYARELVTEASMVKPEETDISELILGTECGGSDPTSGIAANPVIGECSDLLVKAGATSVLSETTEFIGGEHILARRAATKEVSDRIFDIVYRYEEHVRKFGYDLRDGNPSPGNRAGGITTLEEKSLGCIHKGGHSTINAVYDYAKPLKSHEGLVIMDTPGYDAASVAAMAAGGCQLVVFSTGRGTPTGNPIVPVIKLTGNKFTFESMKDNIDFDASPIVYGENTIEELGRDLYDLVIETANGRLTKAEALGFMEISLARVCNFT